MSKIRNRKYIPWLFHLPTLITLFAITMVPFVYVVILSFRAYSLAIPRFHGQFVGLTNYAKLLFSDNRFWGSLSITAEFCLVVVSIELILGMGIATLLNQKIRGRRIFTCLIMIPMMLAPVTVGLIWRFLLNAEFGIVSYFLKISGIDLKLGLLGAKETALFTVMFIDIWEWTPFMTLVMLAGLRSVPLEPVEAARIDGATGLQVFRYIALPLIKPLIVVAILLRSIDSFKIFDQVYILTGGGPGSTTELASMYAYRITFKNWNMGYGAAVVLMLFLIVLLFTNFFYSVTQKRKMPPDRPTGLLP